MAKLVPNALAGPLHGKVGDLVFVPASDGSTIVKHAPVRTAEFTEAELRSQSDFQRALAYVQVARQQADVYAAYRCAARQRHKRACDLAHADFRRAPVIRGIDLHLYGGEVGQPIRVQAEDDFAVASVEVALSRLNGVVLEAGPARLERTETWLYLGQSTLLPGETIVVVVTARDRPGNTVSKGCHHAIVPV